MAIHCSLKVSKIEKGGTVEASSASSRPASQGFGQIGKIGKI